MTTSSKRTVALVVAALILLVAGVGWISASALRLERGEVQARRQAALEEAVRLALWRMDSFVAPILAREQTGDETLVGISRSFVATDLTVTRVAAVVPAQVPDGQAARGARIEFEAIERKLSRAMDHETAIEPGAAANRIGTDDQTYRNSLEWSARSKSVKAQTDENHPAARRTTPAETLRPLWAGGELLLARRRPGGQSLDVVVLDRPGLERRLLAEVADLLPKARLEPVIAVAGGPTAGQRQLASLPLLLIPGPLAATIAGSGAPVVQTLAVAWVSVLLAVAAVVALLLGAVALSERRAVFVSAVTHELRTPLTTFRTYTEMLARGMVPETSRADYIDTLQREAERLGHLVENVLLYAGLQRARTSAALEPLHLRQLLERVGPRLEGRAAQAGMTLHVSAADVEVRGDGTAIEQILFNLVDNACKYAATADDKRIHVELVPSAGQVQIVVRDHGAGIPAADVRRLFRPFSRSARDAAGSAPGVGLGLALSRRLARAMGGDLELRRSEKGAYLVVTLRST